MPKSLLRSALISILLVTMAVTFHAQTPGGKPDGYPEAGQPTIITLISPGAAPRTALRYNVAPTYKGHMDMNMTMGMSMSLPGMGAQSMDIPTMKLGADIGVTSVTPAGDIAFDFAYTGVRLDQTAGVDPTVSSMIAEMDAALKSVRGTGTTTSRGASRGFQIDLSKVNNPQISQMMGSLSSSLDNVLIPLPEEAVGVGARWESRQAIKSQGFQVFQKTLWELVSFDGKTAKLKATLEQMAPPQPLNSPAMPAGADMSLDKFTGAGTGTLAISLDALVPTSEVNSQTNMSMSVNAGGSAQQISIGMTLKMTIAPGKS